MANEAKMKAYQLDDETKAEIREKTKENVQKNFGNTDGVDDMLDHDAGLAVPTLPHPAYTIRRVYLKQYASHLLRFPHLLVVPNTQSSATVKTRSISPELYLPHQNKSMLKS